MGFLLNNVGTGTQDVIYQGLQVQSSCQGAAVTIGWGRGRISGNMLWYGDFQQHPYSQSGGKGGGGSGTEYIYSASFILGVSQGTVKALRELWDGQTIISLTPGAPYSGSGSGKTAGGAGPPTGPFPWGGGGFFFPGALGQTPWTFLTTNYPTQAVPYNLMAILALENFNLGSGAQVPSLMMLVDFGIQDAPDGKNAQVYSVISDALINEYYGLGFPAARLDACSAYVNYCAQLGFFVSPNVTGQSSANDMLGKLIEYTNAEFCQKSGKLTIVPYGDLPLTVIGNSTTSSTSLTVGTGSKTLTVPTGLSWLSSGLPVTIASTTAPSTQYMTGTVTSYNSGTGALVVNVTAIEGSGTNASWNVSSSQAGTISEGPVPIPTAPYQIQVADYGSFVADAGVFDAVTNVQFTNVYLTKNQKLKAGQYTVSAGVYSFSKADYTSGREVIIQYSVNNAGTAYLPASPVADLTDDDFLIKGKDKDPVTIARKRAADVYNSVRMEFLDSALCQGTYVTTDENGIETVNQVGTPYPPTIAYAWDQAEIETYGLRAESVQQAHFFTDAAPAQIAAQLRLQRIGIRNTYKLTVNWSWFWLDLMDVITITDSILGLSRAMVRIKEIQEDDDGDWDLTVEDLLPGAGSAEEYAGGGASPFIPASATAPGSISAPVIFEPPIGLSGFANSLWMAVAGTGEMWGGCQVWASTDGEHYELMPGAIVTTPTRYGVTTADYPLGADPDTTDTLAVNLSESLGVLTGGAQADADADNLLALVGSEVVSFSAATLTSLYNYNLTTYIRRGQYGTTITDHPLGSSFVRLDNNVYKTTFLQSYVGKTLYFKFPSFNIYNQQLEDLANVPAYTFTPAGTGPIDPNFPGAILNAQGTEILVENAVG
jgi:hypothetical protein